MNLSKSAPSADRVPTGMKLGYSIGDFGANLAFQTTSFYLMFFFTDVFGIAPALAGSIFLYAKLWDAVTDPLMGTIADHTRSRWGKFRPYLLFGALPLGVAVAILFQSPDLSPAMKYWYGLGAFMLFATTITVVNMPYLAMTPSLTLDSHERSVVTGVRVIFGIAGSLAAAGATLPLVGLLGGGNQQAGFAATGILYGVIVALLTLVSFATVRERVFHSDTETAGIKENLKVVGKNRPFMLLTAGVFMHMIGMNIMAVVVNYFFKYNLNAENLIPVAFLCLFVTAAFSIPLFVKISKRTSKKFAYNLGMGIVVAAMGLIFLFGERGPAVTIGLFVLAGVGLSTNWLSPWSMIPDTVEYSEWKTGLRREGILYGIFYFFFKVGTAMAGFLVGTALAMTGYIANVTQTEGALLGIRAVFTLLPMAFLVAGIILIGLFPIDAAMHGRITGEIEARRRA
ncbi:MAG: MFS transporter [Spirochaetes bacterium]|nr:MFS transporter [Spirochaetota bacterium]